MDREARFRALFDSAYGAVRRYAHHRGVTGPDAEDLVADVFTIAWRRLDDVPAGDAVPWLLAVARNHWRNHVRRLRRERALVDRLVGEDEVPPPSDPLDVSSVRRALAALPEADREVLRLVAWDGLAPREVAVVLGCTAATARVRLHRARRRLAVALAETETTARSETPPPSTARLREVRDATTRD